MPSSRRLLLFVAALGLAGWGAIEVLAPLAAQTAATHTSPRLTETEIRTKLLAARQYFERKAYEKAERIYTQILSAEPHNHDALRGLAETLSLKGELKLLAVKRS